MPELTQQKRINITSRSRFRTLFSRQHCHWSLAPQVPEVCRGL